MATKQFLVAIILLDFSTLFPILQMQMSFLTPYRTIPPPVSEDSPRPRLWDLVALRSAGGGHHGCTGPHGARIGVLQHRHHSGSLCAGDFLMTRSCLAKTFLPLAFCQRDMEKQKPRVKYQTIEEHERSVWSMRFGVVYLWCLSFPSSRCTPQFTPLSLAPIEIHTPPGQTSRLEKCKTLPARRMKEPHLDVSMRSGRLGTHLHGAHPGEGWSPHREGGHRLLWRVLGRHPLWQGGDTWQNYAKLMEKTEGHGWTGLFHCKRVTEYHMQSLT